MGTAGETEERLGGEDGADGMGPPGQRESGRRGLSGRRMGGALLGRGVGAGAERKREPGQGNGPRRKGREGERMGCCAAAKGSGPPSLGCLGWAGKKGKWAMGRFELVWAILIPFLSYF